jgi:hypothetical protein
MSAKYAFDLTAEGRSRLIDWLHQHHRNPDRIVSIEEFVDEILQNANEGNHPQCEIRAMHSIDGGPRIFHAWLEEIKWRPMEDEE